MLSLSSFSPRLPKPGETVVGTKFEKKYGGKGANQCVAAAKLGGSTALIASVGICLFFRRGYLVTASRATSGLLFSSFFF